MSTPISTPSALGGVELMPAGVFLNTWGDPHLNDAMRRITEMAQGAARVAVNGSDILDATVYVQNEARMAAVFATGSGGTLTIPSEDHNFIVSNHCGSGLTLTTGAGRTVVVPPGVTCAVLVDGAIGHVDLITDPSARAYTDAKVLAAYQGVLPGGPIAGGFIWTDPADGAAHWRLIQLSDVQGLVDAMNAQARQKSDVQGQIDSLVKSQVTYGDLMFEGLV